MQRIRGTGGVEGRIRRTCAMALAAVLATAGLPSLAGAEAEAEAVEATEAATPDDATAEAVGDTGADQRKTAVEEIVVTSRKRAETLQKVPVSVTAFNDTNLAEIGAADVSAISNLTPNLMINRTASGSSAYVTCMRGLCRTDTTLTDDPYVGLYFNGVYTGKAMGSVFDVADIERIEVVRGPQGTLFGKNTIGGAVNMISARPSGEAGAEISFLGGNYGTTNVKGIFDLPELYGFSMKVSAMNRDHEAFTRNLNPAGHDLGSENRQAVLVDLLWEPTDVFTADFTFDWGRQRETPYANFVTQAEGIFSFFPDTIVTNRRLKATYAYDEDSKNDVGSHGYTLTLNWNIGDLGPIHNSILKSITGHRRFDDDYIVNSSGFDVRVLYNHDDFETRNTSQELQFNADTLDKKLEILAGFFYLHEEGFYENAQGYMADPTLGFTAGTFMDLITDTWINYNSYAFFTEEAFSITDDLRLSAGVRYTYEARDGEHAYNAYNTDGFVPGAGFGFLGGWNTAQAGDTRFTSSTWSPRVLLSWNALDELMIFGGWSRGFKSGGFNARSILPALWNPYDDQKVDSFELGFKSNFWDRRVQFNVTGFFELVDDAQVQFNRITASGWEVILSNAGDAHIYGAEFETIARPVEGLEIVVGLGITENDYTKVINPWTGEDEKNERHMEFAPKYNWNLSGRYIFPPSSFGTFYLRADYTGSSKIGFNTAIADDKVVEQDAYGILNLRLALTELPMIDDRCGDLELAFVANNVTNKSYRIGGYGAAPEGVDGNWYTNVYGDPRFLGAEITYRWGSRQ